MTSSEASNPPLEAAATGSVRAASSGEGRASRTLGGLAGRAIWISLGTALGQGLVLATTLLLARSLRPAAFGELALLVTVTNIAGALACLRYDIMLPAAADEEVRGLTITAALSSCAMGALVALVGLLVRDVAQIAILAQHPLMCGCAVTLAGFFQLSAAWLLRRGAYLGVGVLRASQGLIFPTLALASGAGLLWAHVGSFAAGLLVLLAALAATPFAASRPWRAVARANMKAPLMSLPGAALDVIGFSVLVWVLVGVYGAATAGEYSQVQRAIGAPLMLLSMSSAQVLLRQTAELRHDQKALDHLLLRVFGGFAVMSVVLILVAGIAAEPAFRLLLGPRWHISSSMALAVACAVSVRASVSPLSSILILWRRFDVGLAWQAIYFACAVTLFPLLASHFAFATFVWLYALHEALQYSLYFALIWRVRKNRAAA